jgi:hypothetical protein
MKLLVLVPGYPDANNSSALSYVKVRNHYYREEGISDIIVLNFSLQSEDYILDGFKVISLKSYKRNYTKEKFDVLICHAPNIRNHFLFLKQYQNQFSNVVFFFHGHEVLNINKEYPRPYFYQKKRILSRLFMTIYDRLKFFLWHHYFKNQSGTVHLVFVSEWIRNKFIEYVGVDLEEIKAQSHLIYNGVSSIFENESYDRLSNKEYDFITIRSNLDEPKYAVDVINNLAWANPNHRFLLIGRGDFFDHFKKAKNIEQIERYLTPNEIVTMLNKSKCGLMPTKNDTQGIMACEMATFGMPLITSDIDVCKVVFEGFDNVSFISNEKKQLNLSKVYSDMQPSLKKNLKFSYNNTIIMEIKLLKSLVGENINNNKI